MKRLMSSCAAVLIIVRLRETHANLRVAPDRSARNLLALRTGSLQEVLLGILLSGASASGTESLHGVVVLKMAVNS